MKAPYNFLDWPDWKETVQERLTKPYRTEGPASVLDPELIRVLTAVYDEELGTEELRRFSLPQLVMYLQSTHRYYLQKKLPEIEQSLWHIMNTCQQAEAYQVLSSLVLFFNRYKEELIDHIQLEEKGLFPYIWQLHQAYSEEWEGVALKKVLDESPLKKFNEDHHSIEDELVTVKNILFDYAKGSDLPLSFRVFLNQVQYFELELQKHALIEDHVLVPLVRDIELELKAHL
ncbi:MAG: hemerythrin [Spirosomataceae bacterium]